MGKLTVIAILVLLFGESIAVKRNISKIINNGIKPVLHLDLRVNQGKRPVDETGINYCAGSGTGLAHSINCYNFTSGGSDHIDMGNNKNLNFTTSCTISFWFKQATGLVSGVFKYGSSTLQSYRLVVNSDNKIYWIFSSNGSNALYGATSGTFPVNVWNHVAAVYDGNASTNATRCIIYLNGVPMSLNFSGTIPTSLYQASTNVTINRYNGSTYGNGKLGLVRMFRNPLTTTQVLREYTDTKN
jgi:hypothetical protein